MAKSSKEQKHTDGKGKMTVVMFHFEGSNETMQEGIKAFGQALEKIVPLAVASRAIPLKASPALLAAEDREEEIEAEEGVDIGENEEELSSSTPPRSPRKYLTPKFLSDLDLTRGNVPFKEFCTQKNPEGNNDKYLVIATWFHKHGGLDSISPNHIFTGYQTMGWKNNQKDFTQPLRIMKKKKSYFDNPERNMWKITSVGLNAVDQIGTT